MAALCFLALAWLLIDYASPPLRAGIAILAVLGAYVPALDPSTELELTPGFVAFAAAAAVGAVTAVIDRTSIPTTTAATTRDAQ